jgi:uracil-DNA glycosylase
MIKIDRKRNPNDVKTLMSLVFNMITAIASNIIICVGRYQTKSVKKKLRLKAQNI